MHDSLGLYKVIFEQSAIGTQIFRPDGTLDQANEAWFELWKVKQELLSVYNILLDPRMHEVGLIDEIRYGFSGHVVVIPMVDLKALSPSVPAHTYITIRLSPIFDQGKLIAVVMQSEDVSEVKRSAEVTSRLAAIVESSEDAIISKGLDGIIRSWNSSAEKLFGYKADEVIGKHIFLIIPPELQAEEVHILSRLAAGEKVEHFRTTRVKKDGTRIALSLSISPIKDSMGNVIGASKIAHSIEDQLKSEHALREGEERLRLALDAGRIGVWDWNLEQNVLSWTREVYQIHGLDPDKVAISLDQYKDLIHPDDRQRVWNIIEQSWKEHTYFSAEFRIVRPDNQVRWVTTRAKSSYSRSGKPIRMFGATSEITRQKQLEQHKTDFLSMASHELKTPITSMKMFVELLAVQLQQDKESKSFYFASRIKDQMARLTELTNDLLDVSRIETGKLKLNLQDFDLADLVKESVDTFQSTTEHLIRIERLLPVKVHGDKYRVFQVLVNLISNAIKFSPIDKEILITMSLSNRTVTVCVKDQGIGVAEDKLVKIFDRHYQATGQIEKTYPGLGLGLFISKEIIDRHNGKIGVSSTLGQGSTFFFSLPV